MEYVVSTIGPVSREYLTKLIMAHMNYVNFRSSAFFNSPVSSLATRSTTPFLTTGSRVGQPFGVSASRVVQPLTSFGATNRLPNDKTPVWQAGVLSNTPPELRIRQVSDLGQSQQDFFFWEQQRPPQMLVVSGYGMRHEWKPLPPGWNNPQFARATAVNLGRATGDKPLQVSVSSMSTAEKVAEAMRRSMKPEYMSAEIIEIVKGMITPEAIAQMLAIEAVYAISMFFGVGEVVTVLLVVAGTYFVGAQVLDILKLLKDFVKTVTSARNDAELEQAAKLFAKVMVMGTDMVVQLLTRKGKKGRSQQHNNVVRVNGSGGGGPGRTPTPTAGGTGAAPPPAKKPRRTGPLRWRQKPNDVYTRKSPNGNTTYTYKTDAHGRIISAEGELKLGAAPRNEYDQRNVGSGDGRQAGDAGGHLIGSQFGGVGTAENMTAMNHAKVNAYPNGEFGKLEKRWADELKKTPPSKVEVKIEPIYKAGNTTSRPDSYKVTEKVNGKRVVYKMDNP